MLFKKKFLSIFLLFLLSIILTSNADDNQPSVIVVGAGVSGIAAASKLMENGFKNVKILEAEDRIGGRIHTAKMGDQLIELGAQWIHGVEGNVAYELAAPHGVVDKREEKMQEKINTHEKVMEQESSHGTINDGQEWIVNMHKKVMDSVGNIVDQNDINEVNQFTEKMQETLLEYAENNKNSPLGDYMQNEIDKYIEAHPVWKENKKGFTHQQEVIVEVIYAADSWNDVSTATIKDFHNCPGEFFVNWKTYGYKTILDILMKRLPKPEEELPVMNNTVLNAEVSSIDYSDPNGKVTVKTTNGDTHTGDHVIVTCSVGVLKDEHKSFFKPVLPEDKQKAIEGMGYGTVAKIFLFYEVPWWKKDMEIGYGLFWMDKDLEMLEKDVEKNWLLGFIGINAVENKPNFLQAWVSGKYSRDMEKLTDEQVKNHVVEVLQRFFGKTHNMTEPTEMMRSMWSGNKHFKGTYSYRKVMSDPDVVNPTKLSEPVGEGKPVVLFAGEATSPHHYSTVHGAIETGWREAERIMAQYRNLKKIMKVEKKLFVYLLLSIIYLNVNGNNSPSVIIVGAGPSGIAAASKLFQNGFQNIKILEAENRIGGRVYTTQFKDYLVDLGAQWVHGEKENVVFEMVWTLGILERSNITSRRDSIFDSSGKKLDQAVINDFHDFHYEVEEALSDYAKEHTNVSVGEYYTNEFNKYFDAHLHLKENEKGFYHLLDMMTMAGDGAETWWDVSITSSLEYHDNPGDHLINWKERGYGTMLDILIKRFPNPEEELPVLNNTILNAEVTSINYSDPNGKVKVKTANGDLYLADHVIYTCSLGVLKDEHKSLFQPHLSEEKQKTIEALGFGIVGKIFLYFEDPWWSNEKSGFTWINFLWKNEDFEEIKNNPEKKWLLGLVGFGIVEHKSKLLEGWLSGNDYTREMEKLSDEQVLKHCIEVLQRFLGKIYNITTPSAIIRTKWSSNNHFKGTYSFRSMKSDAENVWAQTLANPIDETNLKILFAGEATNPHRFSTVQGAIETGFREADRIIKHQNLNKMIFEGDFLNKSFVIILTIILKVNTEEISPSVIIIGAGSSGLAAASRLFQNGFQNIKILEAENRIGGRVYTTQFDDYFVDLGAQWVHGENIVFEMAWSLGFLERSILKNYSSSMFDSSGEQLDETMMNDFYDFYHKTEEKLSDYSMGHTRVSTGEFFTNEFRKYFNAHSNFKENEKGLFQLLDMMQSVWQSSDTWLDISMTSISEYHKSTGDNLINWKDRGYGTILELLIKHYPKLKEELPVMNNTILNTEVTLIDYSDAEKEKIIIKTSNGEMYSADHVIVTCSIGVLKDKHHLLFKPALPKQKQNTIESLGFGNVGKIFLSFEEPWWSKETVFFDFLWKNEDLEIFTNEPEKNWLLGLIGFEIVEHKPRLLEGWISGNYSREMEKLNDEQVKNHCTEVLQRFLGKKYNITKPTGMIRTKWNSNNNFKGTYSFRSIKSDAENAWAETLAEPIDETKLMILFAGEATSQHQFGTVHGAIQTGYREANRLIKLYSNLATN
ncbi:uncharacterized protein LOC127279516 [Leptopilina boulardi]|uniref:uncharacterized protein LOC127279516 n=1 Tax=Leptopilina boulardi TaxID=63433 RepID=UPI0021F63127|nr:uncharacterized protein LOC127279516 [Leptopilina boulardi]